MLTGAAHAHLSEQVGKTLQTAAQLQGQDQALSRLADSLCIEMLSLEEIMDFSNEPRWVALQQLPDHEHHLARTCQQAALCPSQSSTPQLNLVVDFPQQHPVLL